jgi:hypothetical protein
MHVDAVIAFLDSLTPSQIQALTACQWPFENTLFGP